MFPNAVIYKGPSDMPLSFRGESGANDSMVHLCSKCERQGHNLFYVDNTAQVRGGLRGTLGEE